MEQCPKILYIFSDKKNDILSPRFTASCNRKILELSKFVVPTRLETVLSDNTVNMFENFVPKMKKVKFSRVRDSQRCVIMNTVLCCFKAFHFVTYHHHVHQLPDRMSNV